MTTTSVRTFTRLNATTNWYNSTPQFTAHWQTTYINTGLIVSRTTTTSTDHLTLTITNVWKDSASFDIWLADPLVTQFASERQAYNVANNITGTDRQVTTV